MPTKTDRKVLMLMRVVNRLRRQKGNLAGIIKENTNIITTQQKQINKLVTHIRGDGAEAPVPDDVLQSYTQALEYAIKAGFLPGRILSWYKCPDKRSLTDPNHGQPVIDWEVNDVIPGVIYLRNIREWTI